MKRLYACMVLIVVSLCSFFLVSVNMNSAKATDQPWTVEYNSPDPNGAFTVWMDEDKDYDLANAEVTISGDNFEKVKFDDDGQEVWGIVSKNAYTSRSEIKLNFPDVITIRYPDYGVKADGSRTDLIFTISDLSFIYRNRKPEKLLVAYGAPDTTGKIRLQIAAQTTGDVLNSSRVYLVGTSHVNIKFVDKDVNGNDVPVQGVFKFLFTDIDIPDRYAANVKKVTDPVAMYSKDGVEPNPYTEHFKILSGQASNIYIPVSEADTCLATNPSASSVWRKSGECPVDIVDVPEYPNPKKPQFDTEEKVRDAQIKIAGTVLLNSAGTDLEWGGSYAKTALFSKSTMPTNLIIVGQCENPTADGGTVASTTECTNGTVTNIGESPIIKGFTREYNVTPKCGYQIDNINYLGKDIPLTDKDRSYFSYAPTEFNETKRDSDGAFRSIFKAGFAKIPTPSPTEVEMVATVTPEEVSDPNSPLTLNFKVANNSTLPLTGYHINYSLTGVDQTPTQGRVDVPTIPAGQSATVQAQISAPGATTYAGYSLNAQLSMCDTENTAVVEKEVPVQYKAKITKTANVQNVRPGDSIVYTMLVENTGNFKGTFTVTDILPNSLTPVNLVKKTTSDYTQIPVDSSGKEVTSNPAGVKFTGITLEPKASIQLQITAKVKDDAYGGQIANTASLTSNEKPDDPPLTSTTTVTNDAPPPPAPSLTTMPMSGQYGVWVWIGLVLIAMIPGLYFLFGKKSRKK